MRIIVTLEDHTSYEISSDKGNLSEVLSGIQSNNSGITDIAITLTDSTDPYKVTSQILVTCNFSLIATTDGVTIDIGENDIVFETKQSFDESLIKIAAPEGSQTPIKATIKNITFNFIGDGVSRYKESNWEDNELNGYYAFKFQDLAQVDIENVTMNLCCYKLTNIDIRGCSNVSIRNCNFGNEHTGQVGGIVWIRNATPNKAIENIEIINNTFTKYGNDEAIAIWTYKGSGKTGYAMRNILISGNTFEYAPLGNLQSQPDTDELHNDVLVKIYSEGTTATFNPVSGCPDVSSYPDEYEHIMEDIVVSDNIFIIKELVHKVVSFWCSGYTKTDNLIAKNNTVIIENIDFSKYSNTYHTVSVFSTYDALESGMKVEFSGNTILSRCEVGDGEAPNVEALSLYGGHTRFTGNTVAAMAAHPTDTVSEGPTYSIIGVGIRNNYTAETVSSNIRCRNFVKLDMEGNNFRDLYRLGLFSYTETGDYDTIFLNMTNNTIEGDTKIYCNNIKTMHAVITGNEYRCINECYGLQGFAEKGVLRFCYNKVSPVNNSYKDYCLYKYYPESEVDPHNFDIASVIGNSFKNINNETNLSKLNDTTRIEYDNVYTDESN